MRLDEVGRLGDVLPEVPPDDWFDDMAMLRETQVLSVLHDVARGTASVLLECRQALQVRDGNVAVLALDGTESVGWRETGRRGPLMAWPVVGGHRGREEGRVLLRLDLFPAGSLTAVASRAVLHVLHVPGLPEAPVDYARDDEAVRAGTPAWDTAGTPVVSYRL